MLFARGLFLYCFLPLLLGLQYPGPKHLRILVLAVASYVFYGCWCPVLVILMWFSTVVGFTCGKRIEAARAEVEARGAHLEGWIGSGLVAEVDCARTEDDGLDPGSGLTGGGVDGLERTAGSAGRESSHQDGLAVRNDGVPICIGMGAAEGGEVGACGPVVTSPGGDKRAAIAGGAVLAIAGDEQVARKVERRSERDGDGPGRGRVESLNLEGLDLGDGGRDGRECG